MRISDWSSDVCSSDLYSPDGRERCAVRDGPGYGIMPCGRAAPLSPCALILAMADERAPSMNQRQAEQTTTAPVSLDSVGREARRRQEERRVGKECDSTCGSRWSPNH